MSLIHVELKKFEELSSYLENETKLKIIDISDFLLEKPNHIEILDAVVGILTKKSKLEPSTYHHSVLVLFLQTVISSGEFGPKLRLVCLGDFGAQLMKYHVKEDDIIIISDMRLCNNHFKKGIRFLNYTGQIGPLSGSMYICKSKFIEDKTLRLKKSSYDESLLVKELKVNVSGTEDNISWKMQHYFNSTKDLKCDKLNIEPEELNIGSKRLNSDVEDLNSEILNSPVNVNEHTVEDVAKLEKRKIQKNKITPEFDKRKILRTKTCIEKEKRNHNGKQLNKKYFDKATSPIECIINKKTLIHRGCSPIRVITINTRSSSTNTCEIESSNSGINNSDNNTFNIKTSNRNLSKIKKLNYNKKKSPVQRVREIFLNLDENICKPSTSYDENDVAQKKITSKLITNNNQDNTETKMVTNNRKRKLFNPDEELSLFSINTSRSPSLSKKSNHSKLYRRKYIIDSDSSDDSAITSLKKSNVETNDNREREVNAVIPIIKDNSNKKTNEEEIICSEEGEKLVTKDKSAREKTTCKNKTDIDNCSVKSCQSVENEKCEKLKLNLEKIDLLQNTEKTSCENKIKINEIDDKMSNLENVSKLGDEILKHSENESKTQNIIIEENASKAESNDLDINVSGNSENCSNFDSDKTIEINNDKTVIENQQFKKLDKDKIQNVQDSNKCVDSSHMKNRKEESEYLKINLSDQSICNDIDRVFELSNNNSVDNDQNLISQDFDLNTQVNIMSVEFETVWANKNNNFNEKSFKSNETDIENSVEVDTVNLVNKDSKSADKVNSYADTASDDDNFIIDEANLLQKNFNPLLTNDDQVDSDTTHLIELPDNSEKYMDFNHMKYLDNDRDETDSINRMEFVEDEIHMEPKVFNHEVDSDSEVQFNLGPLNLESQLSVTTNEILQFESSTDDSLTRTSIEAISNIGSTIEKYNMSKFSITANVLQFWPEINDDNPFDLISFCCNKCKKTFPCSKCKLNSENNFCCYICNESDNLEKCFLFDMIVEDGGIKEIIKFGMNAENFLKHSIDIYLSDKNIALAIWNNLKNMISKKITVTVKILVYDKPLLFFHSFN